MILANNSNGGGVSLHASELGIAETKFQLLAQLYPGLGTISFLGHSGAFGLAGG